MANTKQYLVSLLILIIIAAADRYVFVELQPAPTGMVWIDGGNFLANSEDAFTDRDAAQDYQLAGFWIDKAVVDESSFQAFVATTGYKSTLTYEHHDATNASPHHNNQPLDKQPRDKQQVFGLHDLNTDDTDLHALHYISEADALAFCQWKGMELSSARQSEYAADTDTTATGDITVHASQPLSDQSGFRCVKLPEWAHQQGYAID